jgi:hypothetical protein
VTDAERAAIDSLINASLQWAVLVVVVGWWAWWLWTQKLRLPGVDLRALLSIFSRPVMSRPIETPPEKPVSSLETTEPTTADRPLMPVPTQEQMLDIFKVLRAANVSREALRASWRAAGLPLNNDLWAQAKAEDVPATPIAGRPTLAQFREVDPELEYEKPPA